MLTVCLLYIRGSVILEIQEALADDVGGPLVQRGTSSMGLCPWSERQLDAKAAIGNEIGDSLGARSGEEKIKAWTTMRLLRSRQAKPGHFSRLEPLVLPFALMARRGRGRSESVLLKHERSTAAAKTRKRNEHDNPSCIENRCVMRKLHYLHLRNIVLVGHRLATPNSGATPRTFGSAHIFTICLPIALEVKLGYASRNRPITLLDYSLARTFPHRIIVLLGLIVGVSLGSIHNFRSACHRNCAIAAPLTGFPVKAIPT